MAGESGESTLRQASGTAGTPGTGVLSTQGVAGGVAVPTTPSAYPGAPTGTVLFDDNFADGFCGWEELFTDLSGTGAYTGTATSGPLSLGERSQFSQRSLLLQTVSIADPALFSQCNAMKRLSIGTPGGVHRGVVTYEVWFSWGSENTAGNAPRYILFMIDEMYGGVRNFWKLRWRNYDESGAVRAKDWYLSSGNEDTYSQVVIGGTTPLTDYPYNGNKGGVLYVSLTLDLAGSAYRSFRALDQSYDLTQVAGLTPPVAGTDPNFNNGLNFMVGITNRSSSATTASWASVARARATML
jgi:hypothetical protein